MSLREILLLYQAVNESYDGGMRDKQVYKGCKKFHKTMNKAILVFLITTT